MSRLLVIDPHDGPARVDQLNALRNVPGRAVARIAPGGRNADWMYADILRGLGKKGDSRRAAVRRKWCLAWLAGHQVDELIVSHTHLLSNAYAFRALVHLAEEAQIRLWCVVPLPDVSDQWRARFDQYDFQSAPIDELVEALDGTPSETPAGVAAFPSVPAVDFTRFRATCHQVLPVPERAIVDHAFALGLKSGLSHDSDELDEQAALRMVKQHIVDATSRDEAATRIAGVQAGLFRRGWYLRVRLQGVLGFLADLRPSIGPDTVHRLLTLADPRLAALGSIAIASGADAGELAHLTVGDINVTADGHRVALPGRVATIPSSLSPAIRALLHDRGADPSRPLFSDQIEPTTYRSLKKGLSIVANTGAIVLPAAYARQQPGARDQWAYRMGLSVTRL